MSADLFSSDLWKPALDKYAEATGLTVRLFGADGGIILASERSTPLFALFHEHGFEPGLLADCAARCVGQTTDRPAVTVAEAHGLTVVGTSLLLEGAIVGAAVAGYALAGFSHLNDVHRWAKSIGLPFDRLWDIVRRQPPVPERRLMLHGELLQILGDALLRENLRTRQYQDAVTKLEAASAAKDEFLAVLSHELRTPLAPIAGWASVLRKSESLEQVHRGAEIIERNALLESRMVDELLDMSRIAHGTIQLELEILDLAALLRAALEASAQEIEKKGIGVATSMPEEALLVQGDAGRLQQVFRNLLSNAVKFTPDGGTVRIELRRDAEDALVRIADTGKGITPEFLPFAFDIFRQQESSGTHRSHEGLGIGLSLVKKLTELHKGSVRIASPGAGRGTEVTVRLALAPATATAQPDSASGFAATPLAGRSVLVVEDSEDARESLRALLEFLGARVSLARDGREALDLLLQRPAPDLVLCDLLMPRMDGFELLRALDCGAMPVHPPFIAVSGIASDASRTRARHVGFAGHIKKPFDQATLLAAIGAALGAPAGRA